MCNNLVCLIHLKQTLNERKHFQSCPKSLGHIQATLVLAESEPGMYLFIFQNPTSSPYLRWCPHGWFQVFNWKFGCIRAYVTSWFSMLPPKITFYSIFDGSVECTSHARFRFHCNRNRTSVTCLYAIFCYITNALQYRSTTLAGCVNVFLAIHSYVPVYVGIDTAT